MVWGDVKLVWDLVGGRGLGRPWITQERHPEGLTHDCDGEKNVWSGLKLETKAGANKWNQQIMQIGAVELDDMAQEGCVHVYV